MRLGERFFRLGLFDVAIQEWQNEMVGGAEERLKAQNAIASAEIALGRAERAVEAGREACRLSRALLPDHPQRIFALVNLGVAEALAGDLGGAERLIADADQRAKGASFPDGLKGRIALLHGTVAMERGELEAAEVLLGRAATLAEHSWDGTRALAELNLGTKAVLAGQPSTAEAHIRAAAEGMSPTPSQALLLAIERLRLAFATRSSGSFTALLTEAGERLVRTPSALGFLELGRLYVMVGLATGLRALAAEGVAILVSNGRAYEAGWFLQNSDPFVASPEEARAALGLPEARGWRALRRVFPITAAQYAHTLGPRLLTDAAEAGAVERLLVFRAVFGAEVEASERARQVGTLILRYAQRLARGEPWRHVLADLGGDGVGGFAERLAGLHDQLPS